AFVQHSSLQETSVIFEIDVFVPVTLAEKLTCKFEVNDITGSNGIAVATAYNIQKLFDAAVHSPTDGTIMGTATQILEILVIPAFVKSSSITFRVTSDAFFEDIYPVHARISRFDNGIKVEPNCEPVLSRRIGEVLLTQCGVTSRESCAAMHWHLYLQFALSAPPRVSIHLATSIDGQTHWRNVILKFAIPKIVLKALGVSSFTIHPIGRLPLRGTGIFLVTIALSPFTLADYALECHAAVSNERLPSRLRFANWNTLNSAFANVNSNRGTCSGNTVNFGKLLSSDSHQPGSLLVAELAVLADFPKRVQGSVTCLLAFDNAILKTATTTFTASPVASSLKPQPLDPTTWTIKVLDVLTRTPFNRPLLPGEVALIEFEFTVPPTTAVNSKPFIEIVSGGDATLDSPHILAVGESVYWAENYQNCITADKVNQHPIEKYIFDMGTLLVKDNVNSKVIVACYVRAIFSRIPWFANIIVRGNLENYTVTDAVTISSSSNVQREKPFSKHDISLSLVGPNVVEMMFKEYQTLKFRFCAKPGVHLNDLRFEAYSEDHTYAEELLTVDCFSYSASVNYPGLNFAAPRTLLDRRNSTGHVWRHKISLGPVFNS
uniref:REJ domain-containing protein n=2 Tax=Mesocestoides corti TaxID=53468 RepID=A0A5K3G265_MESCO